MAKKREMQENVRCMDCSCATLYQWDDNPVVSNCKLLGKNVANTPRRCLNFIKRGTPPEVKHYTHFT